MDGANLVCVFGRKKCGKTTLLRAIVDEHRERSADHHFVVWDTLTGTEDAWQPEEGVEVLSHVHYSAEDAARYALDHERRCTLIIDEVDKAASPKRDLPGSLALIVNQGRHRGVALLCAARRLSRVNAEVPSNADAFFLFNHVNPNDVDRISEWCDDEKIGETVRRLAPRDYVRVDL